MMSCIGDQLVRPITIANRGPLSLWLTSDVTNLISQIKTFLYYRTPIFDFLKHYKKTDRQRFKALLHFIYQSIYKLLVSWLWGPVQAWQNWSLRQVKWLHTISLICFYSCIKLQYILAYIIVVRVGGLSKTVIESGTTPLLICMKNSIIFRPNWYPLIARCKDPAKKRCIVT